MSVSLSAGSLHILTNNGTYSCPVVQIIELKRIQGNNQPNQQERYKMTISDGVNTQQAMVATQLHHMIKENALQAGSVIKINDYTCSAVSGRTIIILLQVEVLREPVPTIGNPVPLAGAAPANTNSNVTTTTTNTYTTTPTPQHNQRPQQQYQAPAQQYQQPQHTYGNTYQQKPTPTSNAPANPFGQQKSDTSNVHPIKSLNPYQNRWTIKARVTSKSDVRTFNGQKGVGQLFHVDLLDAQGGEIRATMFGDAVSRFYDIFQVDGVYFISKGKLKPANKKFNNLRNEYELQLDRDSIVNPCNDQVSDIPKMHFSFTLIEQILNSQKDDIIDVIGIIITVENIESILTKATNKQLNKRTIIIADTTHRSIELTLWAERAENEQLQPGNVIALKGVKVSDFKTRTLGTLASTQIEYNPDIQECHAIRGWYESQGGQVNCHPLSVSSKPKSSNFNGEFSSGTYRNKAELEKKTFSQIKDESLGRSAQGDEFITKGTLTLIKHENNVWYPACPTPKCGKRVTESPDVPGQWVCSKCGQLFSAFEPRYILSASACDHTGSAWLNAFNEVGRVILDKEANDLVSIKDSNPAEYEAIFQRAAFKQYKFRIRAKIDNYQGVDRVRCSVVSADPIDFAEESRALLQQIANSN